MNNHTARRSKELCPKCGCDIYRYWIKEDTAFNQKNISQLIRYNKFMECKNKHVYGISGIKNQPDKSFIPFDFTSCTNNGSTYNKAL